MNDPDIDMLLDALRTQMAGGWNETIARQVLTLAYALGSCAGVMKVSSNLIANDVISKAKELG